MGLYLQYAVESRGFGFQIDYAVQVYIYNERDCSPDPGLYALFPRDVSLMILSHKIFDQYLFLNFFLIFKTNSRIVPFTDGVVVTDFAIVKIANIFAKKTK